MNLRPPGYEPDELPNCSTPRYENVLKSDLRVFLAPGRRRMVARVARRAARLALPAWGDTACENSPPDCFCFADPTSYQTALLRDAVFASALLLYTIPSGKSTLFSGKKVFCELLLKEKRRERGFVILFGKNAEAPPDGAGLLFAFLRLTSSPTQGSGRGSLRRSRGYRGPGRTNWRPCNS